MKKSIKITIISIVFFAIIAFFCKSEAATASVSASSTNVNVGDSVTIKVNINAAAWNLKVSGATSGSFAEVTSDGNNTSKTESLSFKPSNAGEYTVSLSGDVTDGSSGVTTNVSGSVVIKATEKTTPTPTPTPKATATPTPKATVTPTPTPKVDDEVFKTVNDVVYATTDNINVRKSNSTSSDSIGKIKTGEEITRIAVGTTWSKIKFNGGVGYVRNDMLTTKNEVSSSDKTLKSLLIEECELTPVFNSETTNYEVTVDEKVEKLTIKAVANDEKAKVSITGNENLKDGENTIKIVVTAQDGTARTYIINVTKQKQSDALGLLVLRANGHSLDPKFRSDVFEYKINLGTESIDKLDIIATANKDNVDVEIEGNENLKDGDIITVTVKSKDGEEVVKYSITVVKSAPMVAGTTTGSNSGNIGTKAKKSDTVPYIAIIAFVFIGVMGIIIYTSKKKNKDLEYDEYDEEGADLDSYDNEELDESLFDKSLYGSKYSKESAYKGFDIEKEYANEVNNNDEVDNVYGFQSYDNEPKWKGLSSTESQINKDDILNKYFSNNVEPSYQFDSVVDNKINSTYENEDEHIGFGESTVKSYNPDKVYDLNNKSDAYDKLYKEYRNDKNSSLYDVEVGSDFNLSNSYEDEADIHLDFSNSIQDAISSYENNVGNTSSVYSQLNDDIDGSRRAKGKHSR